MKLITNKNKCPICAEGYCYIGFLKIECSNKECVYFSQEQYDYAEKAERKRYLSFDVSFSNDDISGVLQKYINDTD